MFLTVYITVADYWRLKKDEILAPYKDKATHEKCVDKCILPQIGMLKITEVTETDIEKVIRNAFDSGQKKFLIIMTAAMLRKIFHMAAVDRLVKDDICAVLKPIKNYEVEKRFFSPEQETALLISFQKTKFPELYTLSMLTGITHRELEHCKISDYSKEDKTLTVTRKTYAKNLAQEFSTRVIPLSDVSCAVIEKAIAEKNPKNEFIFGEIELMAHRKEYKIIRRESGIHDFKIRELVSNFGVHAIRLKANPAVIKYYLGHVCESGITSFESASHKNVKDIQACDDYYKELKNGHDE